MACDVSPVAMFILVLFFDFGETADSREFGNFGKFVEPVVSGESHDCVEFADSEEFLSIVLSLLILVIV